MQVDDLILWLVKLGYKRAEAVPDEHGHLEMKYLKGEKCFIATQAPNDDKENDEWSIDVKPKCSWNYQGHSPVVIFHSCNGDVVSFIFIDTQQEEQFLLPSHTDDMESIHDLRDLLDNYFQTELQKFVRTTNAKN